MKDMRSCFKPTVRAMVHNVRHTYNIIYVKIEYMHTLYFVNIVTVLNAQYLSHNKELQLLKHSMQIHSATNHENSVCLCSLAQKGAYGDFCNRLKGLCNII